MRGEPVRGALPEAGFYSLSGVEQADALRRGLVPRSPLSHLTGLQVTQVGPATATVTMPASPWLEWGDGLDVDVLAEAALLTAALTVAPPGSDVRTKTISITPFRPATLDAAKLIAHGRTIRRTPRFAYAEAAVEDDLGRELARATGAIAIRAKEPPPPPSPPLERPFDEPVYATPDPYLRPLPPGIGPLPVEQWTKLGGVPFIRSLFAEEPLLPVFPFFGFQLLGVESGFVEVGVAASEWFCHHDREIAQGVLARLAHQTITGTCHTLATPATRSGTVNFTATFLRPVVPDGQELKVVGQVNEHHDDAVVASATITDAAGARIATAYGTIVFLPLHDRAHVRAEPVLATVLFTDLVGSTARATQLGDSEWREVLADHEEAVRRQLRAFAGREIKTTGDGFLATFESPARAARCALAIREATRHAGMELRAGIHTGDCEYAKGDISGIAVHLASRVLDAAGPGEVLLSSTVRDLLLGSGLRFEDRGHHKLKGIDGDWALFAVSE